MLKNKVNGSSYLHFVQDDAKQRRSIHRFHFFVLIVAQYRSCPPEMSGLFLLWFVDSVW